MLEQVLDGVRVLVAVRSLEHHDYVRFSKPVDPSEGPPRGVGGGAGCPAPPPRATYSLADHTYHSHAAVDTTVRPNQGQS